MNAHPPRPGDGGPELEGSFALLVTPMDASARVDDVAYDRLVDFHLEHSRGLFAVCGTAEMGALTAEERLWLARRAVTRAGTLPVVATGNLGRTLRDQLEETARMSETGVVAVVAVPPPRRLSDDALLAYFGRLARASSVPLLLYEWPGRRYPRISASVYGALVREVGVLGIKDTTGSLNALAEKVRSGDGAVVYQASAPLLVPALRAGARGIMAIVSAVTPQLCTDAWQAHVRGDRRALELAVTKMVLLDALLDRCHPQGAKWLLRRRGLLHSDCIRAGRRVGEADAAALEIWSRAAE